MLDRRQIAAIHAAKGKAGISEEEYRAILGEVAGVSSSKDESLGAAEYQEIMTAIKASGEKRPGWKKGQVSKFREYARICGYSEAQARAELFKISGLMHEGSEMLDNDDFDLIMISLEERFEELVIAGKALKPERIDLEYWRKRLPNGKLTSRQQYEIVRLWDSLAAQLDACKRTQDYLKGFIIQALRLKGWNGELAGLSRRQGIILVDALKRRIVQAEQKLAEAPF